MVKAYPNIFIISCMSDIYMLKRSGANTKFCGKLISWSCKCPWPLETSDGWAYYLPVVVPVYRKNSYTICSLYILPLAVERWANAVEVLSFLWCAVTYVVSDITLFIKLDPGLKPAWCRSESPTATLTWFYYIWAPRIACRSSTAEQCFALWVVN